MPGRMVWVHGDSTVGHRGWHSASAHHSLRRRLCTSASVPVRKDKLRFCSRRVRYFTAHLLTSISRAAVTASELSALVSNCVENCFDSICRSTYQCTENTSVRTQPTRAQRVSPHLPLRHALPVGWLQRIDFVLATKATLKVHDFEQAAVLDIYDHADLPRLHER